MDLPGVGRIFLPSGCRDLEEPCYFNLERRLRSRSIQIRGFQVPH